MHGHKRGHRPTPFDKTSRWSKTLLCACQRRRRRGAEIKRETNNNNNNKRKRHKAYNSTLQGVGATHPSLTLLFYLWTKLRRAHQHFELTCLACRDRSMAFITVVDARLSQSRDIFFSNKLGRNVSGALSSGYHLDYGSIRALIQCFSSSTY